MQAKGPGGCLGLLVGVALLAAGAAFDIRWMRDCGGIALVVWGVLFLVGFLSSAKE